jgi:hypothetical protein
MYSESGTTDARTDTGLDRSRALAVALTLSLVSSVAFAGVALGGVETPDALSTQSPAPAADPPRGAHAVFDQAARNPAHSAWSRS